MTPQIAPAVPAHWPSESALIADLKATFPGIKARPARDFGIPLYSHGAWVAGEACIADGEPIFSTFVCPPMDQYDGTVHLGFIAWLRQRGWLIEQHDTDVYMVTSAAEAEAMEAEDVALQDLIDQHCSLMVVAESLNVRIAQERARRAELHAQPDVAAGYLAEAQESARQVAMLRSVRLDYIGLERDNPANKPATESPF